MIIPITEASHDSFLLTSKAIDTTAPKTTPGIGRGNAEAVSISIKYLKFFLFIHLLHGVVRNECLKRFPHDSRNVKIKISPISENKMKVKGIL